MRTVILLKHTKQPIVSKILVRSLFASSTVLTVHLLRLARHRPGHLLLCPGCDRLGELLVRPAGQGGLQGGGAAGGEGGRGGGGGAEVQAGVWKEYRIRNCN